MEAWAFGSLKNRLFWGNGFGDTSSRGSPLEKSGGYTSSELNKGMDQSDV